MSPTLGHWFARYFLCLGIIFVVRVGLEAGIEFEYRTGFLSLSEKQDMMKKIDYLFGGLIILLPFLIP